MGKQWTFDFRDPLTTVITITNNSLSSKEACHNCPVCTCAIKKTSQKLLQDFMTLDGKEDYH